MHMADGLLVYRLKGMKFLRIDSMYQYRNVFTGATGATAVAPKFLDTLTLFQPGGQILPTIGAVALRFSL